MLYLQCNASGSFMQKFINFVEQRLKFSHFEGSIIPYDACCYWSQKLKWLYFIIISYSKTSHPEVLKGKCVWKICSKFPGERPCWSMISIKLLCNFIETTLRHECSPVNLYHIFRTPFLQNTSRWLLLYMKLLFQ